MKVKSLIIRTAGINCDIETKLALEMCGAKAELVHTNELVLRKVKVSDYDILIFPGGFSYGDDISGGKIWSLHIDKIYSDIKAFIDSGRPLMGICNGLQVLTKLGFLPQNSKKQQTASLTFNDSGKFIAKWITLNLNKESPCLFTQGLPSTFELPIAHGEGKFVISDAQVLDSVQKNNNIALTYANNPNGSVLDIAGICNDKGNCFGLMPHPERDSSPLLHPARTRPERKEAQAIGLEMFRNAVLYSK